MSIFFCPPGPAKSPIFSSRKCCLWGRDAAVARGSVSCAVDATDVCSWGPTSRSSPWPEKSKISPSDWTFLPGPSRTAFGPSGKKPLLLKTVKREIVLGEKTLIMGVLNVTPDSFSDGNRYLTSSAVNRGLQMAEEGADIIDIGGESTRPERKNVRPEGRACRVIPVVEQLAAKLTSLCPWIPQSRVAEKRLKAGAEIVISARFPAIGKWLR